ncbi:MAG TPA: ribonuclease III [Planctomycetaceae bacterium]|nr:ribonuclease III [Planctomycetaceae bacterium]
MDDATDDLPPDEKLRQCEEVLGYQFQDRELLRRCLTHASVARTRLASNERLEFLGDAVLGLVVCELLFRRFPEEPEGELTRMKSALVSRHTCAAISDRFGLEQFLFLGKGLATHRRLPRSILAAAIESLIAGVYLDGGLEAARRFIAGFIEPELEQVGDIDQGRNFKSLLQQLVQKSFGETPVYRVLDEKGPDHSKCFKVAAVIGDRAYPAAWGASKKSAEQRAACNALFDMQGHELRYATD